ncbi:GATA transcription factor 1 isoform X1 [Vigna angularis]|uniref:GATA transcription factor 1 isoform X1 n=1 Tax=Phaseolus angularis TaxID=3914 RepID=UPI0022B30256|nr:GATA transcription factor 1 isoform X1 [Vigna angularis]XP_052730158.1 GATA transcription factor 1 isoform X1 [Vigna angularis]XP_052730159.1 GATA transcription factor 1 isoform X1 [Vigna angularis]XP_052730160.1 GATA transcription factor 1 isoform X1 [Vigna angularis]
MMTKTNTGNPVLHLTQNVATHHCLTHWYQMIRTIHILASVMQKEKQFMNIWFDWNQLKLEFEPVAWVSELQKEFVEEELEWLSNKDAFPSVETFVDLSCIQPDTAKIKKSTPVTSPVLEDSTGSSNSNNSSNSISLLNSCDHLKVPVRARSKRRSRCRPGIADENSGQQVWWRQPSNEISKAEEGMKISPIGRQCQHCGAEKTPQWRAGPLGPKTLCNACGVRFKSGRLVPEYRPASSPTFRSDLHSNSHRKIVEMRRQKQMGMG